MFFSSVYSPQKLLVEPFNQLLINSGLCRCLLSAGYKWDILTSFPVAEINYVFDVRRMGKCCRNFFWFGLIVCGAAMDSESGLTWCSLCWASSGLNLRTQFAGLKPVLKCNYLNCLGCNVILAAQSELK